MNDPQTSARSQTLSDTQVPYAAGAAPQIARTTTLVDPVMALLAETLDDLERSRIANENRLRHLTRDVEDSDGEIRGLGLSEADAPVAAVAAIVAGLNGLEADATKQLQKSLRKHPLGPWCKAQRGVGDKQAARLLAAIGDPFWNDLHGRPRTVSELWAYSGLHVIFPGGQIISDAHGLPAAGEPNLQTDQRGSAPHTTRVGLENGGDATQDGPGAHMSGAGVAPTRSKGVRMNWSGDAKMRSYLIAEACVKQLSAGCKELGENRHLPDDGCACGQFRRKYDEGRLKYAGAVHQLDCKRCGPSGKPALAGSELSAGHQHARAMRLVMKELLKELWCEARRIHGIED